MNKHCSNRIPVVVTAALVVCGTAAISHAGGLNVNLNVGVPVVTPAPPPPAYVPAPAPVPQVVLPAATPPQFVYVPDLGYYVAVGTPYDIAYVGRDYYLYSNGCWYRSPYYGGPWRVAAVKLLPPLLVRYDVREFRQYRDREFRRYEHDREHYRGAWHRPEARREERREERRER